MGDGPDGATGRDLASMRENYEGSSLVRADLGDDPLVQWETWLGDAVDAGVDEPNAMIVATVEAGRPRTRTVLAKGLSDGGLEFYTNYRSRKGRALGGSGPISATFLWLPLHRQVHLIGVATQVDATTSDSYFAQRPRGSRIGAWASEQSEVLAGREDLEDRVRSIEQRFEHVDDIPRPGHWGGYRIVPDEVEFWQGRQSRLHDRFRYTRTPAGWTVDRLYP